MPQLTSHVTRLQGGRQLEEPLLLLLLLVFS